MYCIDMDMKVVAHAPFGSFAPVKSATYKYTISNSKNNMTSLKRCSYRLYIVQFKLQNTIFMSNFGFTVW